MLLGSSKKCLKNTNSSLTKAGSQSRKYSSIQTRDSQHRNQSCNSEKLDAAGSASQKASLSAKLSLLTKNLSVLNQLINKDPLYSSKSKKERASSIQALEREQQTCKKPLVK